MKKPATFVAGFFVGHLAGGGGRNYCGSRVMAEYMLPAGIAMLQM